MKYIEQSIKHCNTCKCRTTHQRNNSKTGLIMLLVHIALIIITAGVWLGILIVYKLLTMKIGGWSCEACK